MGSLPLHPMIVHFPIALAVLTPLLALAVLVFWWLDRLPRGAWALVLLAQALLVGGAYAALETGEREEERVEAVVAESRIEAHEEAAEVFLGGAAGVLLLTLLALVVPGRTAPRVLAVVAVAGMAVVVFLGYRVGSAGGELVYRNGACVAYAGGAGAIGAEGLEGFSRQADGGEGRRGEEHGEHERYEEHDDD